MSGALGSLFYAPEPDAGCRRPGELPWCQGTGAHARHFGASLHQQRRRIRTSPVLKNLIVAVTVTTDGGLASPSAPLVDTPRLRPRTTSALLVLALNFGGGSSRGRFPLRVLSIGSCRMGTVLARYPGRCLRTSSLSARDFSGRFAVDGIQAHSASPSGWMLNWGFYGFTGLYRTARSGGASTMFPNSFRPIHTTLHAHGVTFWAFMVGEFIWMGRL